MNTTSPRPTLSPNASEAELEAYLKYVDQVIAEAKQTLARNAEFLEKPATLS